MEQDRKSSNNNMLKINTKALDPSIHCSFCNKGYQDVRKIILRNDLYICDVCIDQYHELIHVETADKQNIRLESPVMIKEFLDEYIVGQENAKIVISVAVYNHYKRLLNKGGEDIDIDKSNILLVGKTGTGKSLIARTIARFLHVAFCVVDATSLTESGYIGDDTESIILKLLQAADYNTEKAEQGIVFIDEIDKKGAKSDHSGRDIAGEGVQHSLLKLLEGNEVHIPDPRNKSDVPFKINTRDILFICGGAFQGLEKIVERSAGGSRMGFGATLTQEPDFNDIVQRVEPRHLKDFGLIPELIGRLPILVIMEDLSEDQLLTILTEPRHSIVKQFQHLFRMDGVELEFDAEALREIAHIAIARNIGARGLRGIVEHRLTGIQYRLQELKAKGLKKVLCTANTIKKNEFPTLIND